MTENYNQLRFDILEKVRLHPQQPGIGTLLELDLYPDVEIEDQNTHLKIEGYLRLNGTYVPDEGFHLQPGEDGTAGEGTEKGEGAISEQKKEEIAYVIPVEITLPAERADIEQIASEIESFDYKVLSPFELQIEAVLTIDGLLTEMKKEEQQPDYEVVDTSKTATFTVPGPGRMEGEEQEEAEEQQSSLHEELPDSENLVSEPQSEEYEFVHVARYDGEEDSKSEEADSLAEEFPEELDRPTEVSSHFEDEGETQEEESAEESLPAADEERTEMNTRPEFLIRDRGDWDGSDRYLRDPHIGEFDFQDLENNEQAKFGLERLSDSGESRRESTTENMEETDLNDRDSFPDEAEEEEKGTSLEWAQWMLKEEKDQFVKLRMVIVQKEDSLDALAERYEVPASKILHLNRLESNVLEQGQIVYIPSQPRP
ncbi:LysM peptidoglycan-binding domain-containing protein [Salinithrix halophila]|uniref:LysM peptidoglycan-binding domain-containing protein n=1 Tax=Salinithrix halophila TaxID=1485204 RepID=A0ABV8JJ74_9BACL